MILALTVSAIAVVTIAFYPAQFMATSYAVLPFLEGVKPWMVKFGLYLMVQATMTGIGLRAFGRVCNLNLREAWQKSELQAIHIGDRNITIDKS